MNIDNTLLCKLEELGRIRLDDSQRESFCNDLNEIIAYMETLCRLDAQGDCVDCKALGDAKLRSDEVEAHENPEALLEGAAARRDGCFVVPKAIE